MSVDVLKTVDKPEDKGKEPESVYFG